MASPSLRKFNRVHREGLAARSSTAGCHCSHRCAPAMRLGNMRRMALRRSGIVGPPERRAARGAGGPGRDLRGEGLLWPQGRAPARSLYGLRIGSWQARPRPRARSIAPVRPKHRPAVGSRPKHRVGRRSPPQCDAGPAIGQIVFAVPTPERGAPMLRRSPVPARPRERR